MQQVRKQAMSKLREVCQFDLKNEGCVIRIVRQIIEKYEDKWMLSKRTKGVKRYQEGGIGSHNGPLPVLFGSP